MRPPAIKAIFCHVRRILARKLHPHDFTDLEDLASRVRAFQNHYQQIAAPFQWKFTRGDLNRLPRAAALGTSDRATPPH